MKRIKKLFFPSVGGLLLVFHLGALAQSDMMRDDGMMMDNSMMSSGWAMVFCLILGVLLLIALVLSILALLKYLFGK